MLLLCHSLWLTLSVPAIMASKQEFLTFCPFHARWKFLKVRYNITKTGRFFFFLLEVLKLFFTKKSEDLFNASQQVLKKKLPIAYHNFICLFYRESFPNDLQFSILMRFTVDQTQTPSLKVRIFRLELQTKIFIGRYFLVVILESVLLFFV